MEALINLLTSIGGTIWPPTDMTGRKAYGWAVLITVVAMANLTGNILITAAGLGYLTAIYPGTASATDLASAVKPMRDVLTQLQQGQKDEKIRGLNNDLLTSRSKLCEAEKNNNGSAKAFAETQFNNDYEDYQRLSGVVWRIPDCTELN